MCLLCRLLCSQMQLRSCVAIKTARLMIKILISRALRARWKMVNCKEDQNRFNVIIAIATWRYSQWVLKAASGSNLSVGTEPKSFFSCFISVCLIYIRTACFGYLPLQLNSLSVHWTRMPPPIAFHNNSSDQGRLIKF